MFGKTHARPLGTPRRPTQRLERLDVSDLHFADEMPAGRLVDLPGRGKAFVRMEEGPAGAPTVLLVHGLFATADLNWSMAIPVLATLFRVVAPDLRGHGRGLRSERFTAKDCADDLAAIIDTLQLGPVVVVGYSLGGVVAQIFVRRYPELVAGLVLCATASNFEIPTSNAAIRLVGRAVRRIPERLRRAAMLALLAPKSADTERGRWLMSEVKRHDTRALLDATIELARFDSRGWLGSTACPAAVIVATEDTVVQAEAQRELARILGRRPAYEVAGDHFACVKRPTEFNAALVDACVGVSSEDAQ